jgi:radical SAM superfamily enzyme YgiQ (UPF0313 family)
MFVGVESFHRQTLIAAHKTQNHPEFYADIVRLSAKHDIQSHFSNIIGFPTDTPRSIDEHVEILGSLSPTVASFYILTPIPGTEQYDEFLESGWITEGNLDRFDGQCSTWKHPNFTKGALESLLFDCHRRFYTLKRTISTAAKRFRRNRSVSDAIGVLNQPLFSRYSAFRRRHPMSGGVGLIQRDHVADYFAYRTSVFNVGQVPLPKSLVLSTRGAERNAHAKVV